MRSAWGIDHGDVSKSIFGQYIGASGKVARGMDIKVRRAGVAASKAKRKADPGRLAGTVPKGNRRVPLAVTYTPGLTAGRGHTTAAQRIARKR